MTLPARRWQAGVPRGGKVASRAELFGLATCFAQRDMWEEMHDPSHDDRER